jgi:hypothetical protein
VGGSGSEGGRSGAQRLRAAGRLDGRRLREARGAGKMNPPAQAAGEHKKTDIRTSRVSY